MLIDIHAHLDLKEFAKDLAAVIERAEKAGIFVIINNGINAESNRKTLELTKKFQKIIKPALGVYPTDALEMGEEEIDKEIEFIKKNKPVAIGEVGMDFLRSKEVGKQKINFQKFINLAEKLNVPIIIHSRKAEREIVEMLGTSNAKKAILHCFNGGTSLIKKAEHLGCNFSVPPMINHSEHFQKLVEQVSISKLLTESDAPYLGPLRGERNEPSNVKIVVEMIAKIKKMDVEEVKNIIFMNYQKLFSK